MTKTPRLALIAALASNGTIGLAGDMPWHIPEDLAYFKRTTKGRTVVMGRKTWDSLGRALPHRRNIVVTSNTAAEFPGAEAAHSLAEALAMCAEDELVFCIGGAVLYAQALPLAQHLYLTEIGLAIEGDTLFPEIDPNQWVEASREPHTQVDEPKSFDFVVYSRRPGR